MMTISDLKAGPIEQALTVVVENESKPYDAPAETTAPDQAELTRLRMLHIYSCSVPGFALNTTGRFIDPDFLARFRTRLNDQRATVQEDGTLMLFGERMVFANPNDTLSPGTVVIVYLGRSFMCAPISVIEAHIAKVEVVEKAEKERERIRLIECRDEAIAFNARLSIPVKWTTGIKDVLSGLSPNSDGSGMTKASVHHVYLLEDLHVGRLHRNEGDFLCGNSKARWGARYIDPKILCSDGDGKTYEPKVTCKTCLEIVKRVKIAVGKAATKQ